MQRPKTQHGCSSQYYCESRHAGAYYMSRITCHVSHVTYHMSRITCHISHVSAHLLCCCPVCAQLVQLLLCSHLILLGLGCCLTPGRLSYTRLLSQPVGVVGVVGAVGAVGGREVVGVVGVGWWGLWGGGLERDEGQGVWIGKGVQKGRQSRQRGDSSERIHECVGGKHAKHAESELKSKHWSAIPTHPPPV
jgi:hypothetical protein